MTNSDDIQAAAELLLFGQRVKMASTVPALRSASPLHLPPLSPTSPPPPAPTHTGRLSDPRRRFASGRGEAAGRMRVLFASSRLRQPGLPSPPPPPCSSSFALWQWPRALRCRATACRPQGHPVLCGSPWPRRRADWYLAAHRGLAPSCWLVDTKLTDPL